ncbi:hypothetical protein KQH42_25455 [Streptomyces sp. CHA1]|uniref:hypothetical protein n=1 Tax=Streptomyces TaxID=1883 RepID=UPI0003C331E3|nr:MULTISPECIES: hypothetical protein [unclassified Streptomyces]UYM23381.1 hypothetical protein NQP46_05430 [Streptomyces albus]WSB19515.1 hypothetical protein OHB02_04400 [Streptomyces albidoflavus]ESP96572.1 Secreted protein [Streptomyces sp. GBA 94-10 4N24]ESQ02415.1 Secreted protein [Streptomyces sp. PVA_94-07]MBP3080658.1 hypothetical protein [Streptomyces sp. 604F]
MQHPAVPELAHTRARPLHWVATAAAVSAVVALTGLLQPGPATAQPAAQAAPADPGPAKESRPAPPPAAPGTEGARFPLDCGPADAVVQDEAEGDLDGDRAPETVAVVHCDAGSGTPPRAVYVLTAGQDPKAPPRVVATLLDPLEQRSIDNFAVRDGVVRATLLGYSSVDIPRCCPDTEENVTWRWSGKAFLRSDPARSAGA